MPHDHDNDGTPRCANCFEVIVLARDDNGIVLEMDSLVEVYEVVDSQGDPIRVSRICPGRSLESGEHGDGCRATRMVKHIDVCRGEPSH